MGNTKKVGDRGEARAVKFLKKKGYRIIDTNYRTRFGEIDIIAERDGLTVFVEVKFRQTESKGLGYESVTTGKQSRLIAAARGWMAAERKEVPCRFDVISLDESNITHIENAFIS